MKLTVRMTLFSLFLCSACSSPFFDQSAKPADQLNATTSEESSSRSASAPQSLAKVDLPPTDINPESTADEVRSSHPTPSPSQSLQTITTSEVKVLQRNLPGKMIGSLVNTDGKTVPMYSEIDLKTWKKISEEDGIVGYQKNREADDHVAFRGETVIQAPLKKVAAVLSEESLRKKWIDSYADGHVIQMKNAVDRIEYNHIKAPWPFEDRDFVYHAQVKPSRNPNRVLLTMTSTEMSTEPPKAGMVRGLIDYSYYYMEELPEATDTPTTKVVIEMSVDPKGVIPKWLVTLSQKQWPHNTLRDLKKLSQRQDLVVPPFIQEYFSEKEIVKRNGSASY